MEEIGEVEMKDVGTAEKKKAEEKPKTVDVPDEKMELDGIE